MKSMKSKLNLMRNLSRAAHTINTPLRSNRLDYKTAATAFRVSVDGGGGGREILMEKNDFWHVYSL